MKHFSYAGFRHKRQFRVLTGVTPDVFQTMIERLRPHWRKRIVAAKKRSGRPWRVGELSWPRFLWTHNCPKEPRKDEPDDRDFAWIAWCCCWPCGKRGRAQPVHAFHRAIGAGRGSGTGPALERWTQAGGCSASASWRGGGKPVAGTGGAGVPAGALARARSIGDRRGTARTRGGRGERGAGRGNGAGGRADDGERGIASAGGACRPFGPAAVAVMAAAISPGTGRVYGVACVCEGFGVARSSFYAWRRQQQGAGETRPALLRRGPKPAISDAVVLSAIRADLERSPWIGEGHRKVWARLRVLDDIRVARKRVLRLMRENGLLSPYRHMPRSGDAHEGRIVTDAPNLMWGTDATQIPTVLDGKVWLFAVVEHWNAEAMGWNVAKIGDR